MILLLVRAGPTHVSAHSHAERAHIGRSVSRSGVEYGFTCRFDTPLLRATQWASICTYGVRPYGKGTGEAGIFRP